jgi:hypothetical protein
MLPATTHQQLSNHPRHQQQLEQLLEQLQAANIRRQSRLCQQLQQGLGPRTALLLLEAPTRHLLPLLLLARLAAVAAGQRKPGVELLLLVGRLPGPHHRS